MLLRVFCRHYHHRLTLPQNQISPAELKVAMKSLGFETKNQMIYEMIAKLE